MNLIDVSKLAAWEVRLGLTRGALEKAVDAHNGVGVIIAAPSTGVVAAWTVGPRLIGYRPDHLCPMVVPAPVVEIVRESTRGVAGPPSELTGTSSWFGATDGRWSMVVGDVPPPAHDGIRTLQGQVAVSSGLIPYDLAPPPFYGLRAETPTDRAARRIDAAWLEHLNATFGAGSHHHPDRSDFNDIWRRIRRRGALLEQLPPGRPGTFVRSPSPARGPRPPRPWTDGWIPRPPDMRTGPGTGAIRPSLRNLVPPLSPLGNMIRLPRIVGPTS